MMPKQKKRAFCLLTAALLLLTFIGCGMGADMGKKITVIPVPPSLTGGNAFARMARAAAPSLDEYDGLINIAEASYNYNTFLGVAIENFNKGGASSIDDPLHDMSYNQSDFIARTDEAGNNWSALFLNSEGGRKYMAVKTADNYKHSICLIFLDKENKGYIDGYDFIEIIETATRKIIIQTAGGTADASSGDDWRFLTHLVAIVDTTTDNNNLTVSRLVKLDGSQNIPFDPPGAAGTDYWPMEHGSADLNNFFGFLNDRDLYVDSGEAGVNSDWSDWKTLVDSGDYIHPDELQDFFNYGLNNTDYPELYDHVFNSDTNAAFDNIEFPDWSEVLADLP